MRTTTVEKSKTLADLLNENAERHKAYDLEELFDLLPKMGNVTWVFGYGGYDVKEDKDLDEYYMEFEIEHDGDTEYKSFFNESMFDVVFEAVCWWLKREKEEYND